MGMPASLTPPTHPLLRALPVLLPPLLLAVVPLPLLLVVLDVAFWKQLQSLTPPHTF